MTTRVICTDQDRRGLITFIEKRPLPITVEIVKGKRRSVEQNRYQRQMLNDVAEQTGQTAEEVRAYCKLHIGVPILLRENEAFAEKYYAVIKPMQYETKLALMAEPFDFPVTRLMTTEQKTRYLDGCAKHFAENGIILRAKE